MNIFIRLEARLRPNIGNTSMVRFDGVHAFGYNYVGSEPIWWNLGHSKNFVYRWVWQIFGAIHAEATARQQESQANFCSSFIRSPTRDFMDLWSAKFHEIYTQDVRRAQLVSD